MEFYLCLFPWITPCDGRLGVKPHQAAGPFCTLPQTLYYTGFAPFLCEEENLPSQLCMQKGLSTANQVTILSHILLSMFA